MNSGIADLAPWVIVAGGFHQQGGMDKANAALAMFLIERETPLHLVAHQVDPQLSARPGVQVHLVPRPAGSFFLGERLLDQAGRAVARRVVAQWPGAHVVVNGGNCFWPDINWVHCVHHAWPHADGAAPFGVRVRNRFSKNWARRRERLAIRAARVVLTNSEKTRSDVIGFFGIEPHTAHTVYLGTDPMWKPATSAERTATRAWLGQSEECPLVVFVGALGLDQNKGFDTLWRAWQALCAREEWDADLIVAGEGNGLRRWKQAVREAGLEARVRFLGFTNRVRDLLAAADLLVSPVRYEAFGLNVQEAICRGIPAVVSGSAGIAELYPGELSAMLLTDSEDATDLANRLRGWRSNMNYWKQAFQPFSVALRKYTWKDMARRIVESTECGERSPVDPLGSLGQAAGVPPAERAAHDLELKA